AHFCCEEPAQQASRRMAEGRDLTSGHPSRRMRPCGRRLLRMRLVVVRQPSLCRSRLHCPPMNLLLAISIKLLSVLLFAMMSALVRSVGETVPLGQVVFFRSAFAIIPVMAIYAWRGEIGAALRTGRPLGHVTRGLIAVCSMFLNFAALAR